MKKTLTATAVLLALLILTLFSACGEDKGRSDTDSSVGTNDCCESSISDKENSTTQNDCCSADSNSSDESSEAENTDDSAVPDCCG